LSTAAEGGLEPVPADRFRGAYPHQLSSYALLSLFGLSRSWRTITRHLHEDTLQRMNRRATPHLMRLRRCSVERPFALLKWVIFGYPRFLLRCLAGAQVETSLATMAYNLKTMIAVLGSSRLVQMLGA